MTEKKDFIDEIIELFCRCYKLHKGIEYSIGRGKKHYYPGLERNWIGNLISIYKQSKPESDTKMALRDFEKLFNTLFNHNYGNSYLGDITLYKICFKINEYRTAIRNPDKINKKGFDITQNTWHNQQEKSLIQIAPQLPAQLKVADEKFYQVTKLPQQIIREYTNEEIQIIKQELLRLAAARDENFTSDTVEEWIRCFAELNYSVSMVVKAIRLAKLQPKYASKEFAMFLNVDTRSYYEKYQHKKS